jgi:hypothetical protein
MNSRPHVSHAYRTDKDGASRSFAGCWVIERTFSWLRRHGRAGKVFELRGEMMATAALRAIPNLHR